MSGARQGGLGMAHGRGGRCFNRAARVRMTSAAKMPLWYGAPRTVRVRLGPRTDWRSAACMAHVRRDGGETRGVQIPRRHGAREHGESVRPQSACGLGWHGAGADAEATRCVGEGATSRRRLTRFCFVVPLFEHVKLQNFE
jgi:hypothetical protein